MSDSRRKAQRVSGLSHTSNLLSIEETLRKREGWKYRDVKELLDFEGVWYQFECRLEAYVFDLALLDSRIFVEFDGVEHYTDANQKRTDHLKDELAKNNNWSVVRIPVEKRTIIKASLLYPVLKTGTK